MASASIYEVLALRYGTVVAPRSKLYASDALVQGEPDIDLRMDFFLYVVRNPHRTVVVDTGFAPEVAKARRRECLIAPVDALKSVSVDPAEVDTLVLTHLHYDHIGNVEHFTHAELVIQERELAFWRSDVSHLPLFAHLSEPAELDAIEQAGRDGRIRTIAGDGVVVDGITARLVGGHTPGQQILEVPTATGPLVLASDAAHFYDEMEQDLPFHATCDYVAACQAYRLLRDMSAGGAVVVPGHDPLVAERFPRRDNKHSLRLG